MAWKVKAFASNPMSFHAVHLHGLCTVHTHLYIPHTYLVIWSYTKYPLINSVFVVKEIQKEITETGKVSERRSAEIIVLGLR